MRSRSHFFFCATASIKNQRMWLIWVFARIQCGSKGSFFLFIFGVALRITLTKPKKRENNHQLVTPQICFYMQGLLFYCLSELSMNSISFI